MNVLGTYVDLARYPIHELGRHTVFADQCWETFLTHGVLTLPDFLTPHGLTALAEEANRVAPQSFRQEKSHNVYLVEDDLSQPPGHPARRRVSTQTSTVADDLIPADSGLRLLYESDELRQFLAHVLGKSGIYPYEDPLASLNLGVTENGQQLNWHFDSADFTTTLFLQNAEEGGAFQYVPNLRGRADEHEQITRILDGDISLATELPLTPGTLVLFAGHNSLHRVAPVAGERIRLMAILSYAEERGVTLDAHTRKTFYGREH